MPAPAATHWRVAQTNANSHLRQSLHLWERERTKASLDQCNHFRETAEALGTGYQTMINSALGTAVSDAKGKASKEKPLTASTLRKILREELQAS